VPHFLIFNLSQFGTSLSRLEFSTLVAHQGADATGFIAAARKLLLMGRQSSILVEPFSPLHPQGVA
jgi:hypothetical protein